MSEWTVWTNEGRHDDAEGEQCRACDGEDASLADRAHHIIGPCVSDLEARAGRLRELRNFAHQHEAADAQARVQAEQDRVQRNQAAVERAQRSLDQANDKLTFAKRCFGSQAFAF